MKANDYWVLCRMAIKIQELKRRGQVIWKMVDKSQRKISLDILTKKLIPSNFIFVWCLFHFSPYFKFVFLLLILEGKSQKEFS